MKKFDILKITCSAIILLLTVSCNQNTPGGDFTITEIGKVPEPVTIEVTSDERHVMYIQDDGNQKQIVFDGLAGPRFDGVYVENSFIYSPEAKRMAYSVATNKAAPGDCATCGPAGKWRAVIDNEFGPEYDKVGRVSFSKDGSKCAYAAMKRKKGTDVSWVIILNGKELPGSYKAVSSESPMFGPDGMNFVCVVKKENGKCAVITNGKEGAEFDQIGARIPVFSPDGAHSAYTGINYVGRGSTVVFDGKAGPNFDLIPETSLVFSPDSKHFAYGTQTKNDWQIVADGIPGKKYAQVDNIVFSRDSKCLTYKAASVDGKWTVVVNGREGARYDSIMKGAPVYSPDAKFLAYGVRKNGKWNVAVERTDNRKSVTEEFLKDPELSFDEIISLSFGPDSKQLSYAVREGLGQRAVIEDSKGDKFDEISAIIYSPDGKRTAYIAKKKIEGEMKRIVVIDGKPGPECQGLLKNELSVIRFSPDSKQAAYAASINGKWYFVINGQQDQEAYDAVCNLADVKTDGFESTVIKNKKLYKLRWSSGNEGKLTLL